MWATCWVVGYLASSAVAADPAVDDLFEKKIRPVLVKECYGCHSTDAKKVRGGLRLDTREAIRIGGDRGPAVVPGDVGASLLIKALRYDELEMPPTGQLSPLVIADFEAWVKNGAPDPRDGTEPATGGIDFEAAGEHWAYQPIEESPLPSVQDVDWSVNRVDRYILAALEAAELSPSPSADRRTLIRRVYFDLIGLPPTFEEVQAFVRDTVPTAYESVVDRLLQSPHYGERWGRHWLDVARYADTKDLVLLYGKDAIRPFAYTYRDYIIRSFNEDTPFDRLVHEQLAADQLAAQDPHFERWRLAAMGFLTLGRMFDNNPHDIYDDRIDVVSRGFLGLTVSCARCHDHKYDAIPTDDYYSLYGVFASSVKPFELPLIADPDEVAGGAEFEAKAQPLRDELVAYVEKHHTEIVETARSRVTDYLVKVATEKPDPLDEAVFFMSLSPGQLKPKMVARWRRYLQRRSQSDDPVFGPWGELMALPESDLERRAPEVIAHWQSIETGTQIGQLNPLVKDALASATIAKGTDIAQLYGSLLKKLYEGTKGKEEAELDGAQAQLLAVLTSQHSPFFFPKSLTYLYLTRVFRDKYHKQLLELDKLAVNSEGVPPRAMVLNDAAEVYNPRVFIRGDPARLGAPVDRQFLRVLSSAERQPFRGGSGRLDLARAITSSGNALTARVLANRIWMHHLGEPLVTTPSDFGVRSDPPSHPELLDYLAWKLIASKWSLKSLHREIVLSRTYQQESFDRPAARERDRGNRLLWRAHRRRLDLESMRDSLLAISGRLDRTQYGRPVDIAGDPENRRRTIYGIVDRQNLPGLFRAFDFANPDQSVARRPETTVPQQALFALNSEFMVTQARSLAALEELSADSVDERIAAFYRRVLTRDPDHEEVAAARSFVTQVSTSAGEGSETVLTAWEQFAQVLLATNELMFVD